jgi:hypothetical protein
MPRRAAASSARGRGSVPSTRGPTRLSRFIRAKYIGGSGWPERMNRTKSASLAAAWIEAFVRSS